MTLSFADLMELDRIPAGWSLDQLMENTAVLEKVYHSAIQIPSPHTVDRTEGLFWQIMWFQDETLKRCGHDWDGPCYHIRALAFHC